MIDRFSKWQRPGGKPANKPPLDVKWRSSHATSLLSKDDRSAHAEAARDTVVFRWAIFVFIALGIAIYVLFFMASGKPD